ncbi:uncharacterized protein DNG_03479 [Cephalotrichum gorgonifer]|uniref:Uncharacterized protein n=1 Tax=Cephalotrichum gorgonifer TaxID=2041049 RepID=A0AAE8STM3_9PEZI|nr:uncharacterized protein DNG_03479 [Cephalotrichum gorgonifer]
MTEPTGDPSLTQDPELVTNSNDLSHQDKLTTLILTEVVSSSPKRRQADDSLNSLVTQVVQTVSLIHYVNADGTPRTVSTVYSNPQTVLVDPVSGNIVRPANNESPDASGALESPASSTETVESSAPSTSARLPETSKAPESSAPSTSVRGPEPSEAPDTSAPEAPGTPKAPSASGAPGTSKTSETADVPGITVVPGLPAPVPSPTDIPSYVDVPPIIESVLPDVSDLVPTLSIVPTTYLPEPSYIELPPSDDAQPAALPPTSSELSSAFPTLRPSPVIPGYYNTTHYSNTATVKAKVASTTLSSYLSSASTTRTTSRRPVITVTGDYTGGSGGGSGGGGVGEPESNSASSDGDNGSTPTGTVVGSVVGSIAGAALLVFLIMALLRWRKRRSGQLRLEDGPDTGSRGLGAAGGANGGRDGGGGMTHRSLGFAAPAILASMSSYNSNRSGSGGSPSGEQGFYRVSGKKLPPVIQYGGDGFTDPRGSTISGASSEYPESHLLDAQDGAAPARLALGQPMRPISGVPVFRSSPARTPVAETNPFADPHEVVQPPTPPRTVNPDAIGRSLTSQDMSRGSSRFTEDFSAR